MIITPFDPSKLSEGDIIAKQRFLKEEGFYPGDLDGDFGAVSRLALIKYDTSLFIPSPVAKIIDVIDGVYLFEHVDKSSSWLSRCMSDSDGIGQHFGDRTAQNDTSAHHDGHAYNADVDFYSVYPSQIKHAGADHGLRVMGCAGMVYHTVNGKQSPTVFADCGGSGKVGEAAYSLLKVLGIPWSPVSGGERNPVVLFHCFPGKPGNVNGRVYPLQS